MEKNQKLLFSHTIFPVGAHETKIIATFALAMSGHEIIIPIYKYE